VSTVPLDRLCAMAAGLPDAARRESERLVKSAVHIVGVGLEGAPPPALARKCWMYFPEASSPYFRVTVFSNYSPANAPEGCWSLMAEVCESAHRPVDGSTVVQQVVSALRADGLVAPDARVVSLWHRREEHGYPTPFRARDEVLAAVLPQLDARGVLSRGRFGAWRYEVSNQDHSFMQGVEAADRLLGIGAEETLTRPDHVNAGAYAKVPAQTRRP
jgi:protoporphyrinogen oxidase